MFGAFHLALKDLRLLSRDRMALFWAGVFPVVFAVFMGSVLSSSVSRESARLAVLWLDEAHTPKSHALGAALERAEGISVTTSDDRNAARDSVRQGKRLAYLRAPPGFGDDPNVSLELGADPSRSGESALLRSSIDTALSAGQNVPRLQQVAIGPGKKPESPWELAFPAAILWGLMGCSATFAVAMVTERASGTELRLRAAPLRPSALLAGKALAAATGCALDAALLLAVARFGFGVKVVSYPLLAAALACITVCFVGLTIFLSTLGRSEQSVSGAGWATMLFMAMLGGAMVPVSFMPAWMQSLSQLSPVKWSISALEAAIWRGASPAELARITAPLLVAGALGFLAGHARTARSEA